MLTNVHHVAYTVSSLEEYKPFFVDVLGVEHVADREMPEAGYRASVCRVGDSCIELQEPIDDAGKEAFLEGRGSGLNHVGYGVEDMDRALERLSELGVSSKHPEPVDEPTFPGCKLIDIDIETTEGISIQLVADPDFDPGES